jgi:hypothetical protein
MRFGRSRRATGTDLRTGPSLAALGLAAALVVVSVAATACSQPGPTPEPQYTAVLIGDTPWPSGTTGQYGLHIDPSLLGKLPRSVDAEAIVEDADSESAALDNADLAKTFDGYAAASIGEVGDADWLKLAIGHFQPDNQTPDVYAAWVDQYATGACSQADGVSGTSQATINDWLVDVATCGGGPTVYTLSLGGGVVLSMFGYGPLDLGPQLIGALY